jgi:hypothetical protein
VTSPSRLLALTLVTLAACGATTRQSFDETAALFHDDLRWGRVPVAEAAVLPSIREAFVQHHRGWGVVVHVMDIEVESLRTASERSTARLRVVWTRGTDSTDVRESLVEEAWEASGGAWRLRNESVIAGDAGLFGTPTAANTPMAPRNESVSIPNG